MRDRARTMAALRRLAERPGTPEEGETARKLLDAMGGEEWLPRVFDAKDYPPGAVIFYCYWAYRNQRGIVCAQTPRLSRGEYWMRIKFDHLKQARWVPVTSHLGCHLGSEPFVGDTAETLHRMDVDWAIKDLAFLSKLRSLGIIADDRLCV